MKTIKVTTFWTAEEALCVCSFLDELRNSILTSYSEEIKQATEAFREEQLKKQTQAKQGDWVDDEIPF